MTNTRLVTVVVLVALAQTAISQLASKQLLRLVQTISMANIKGRLDHMYMDIKGNGLFVAGLENGSLEVLDLQSGKWLRSIHGFKKPQGALHIKELNKLFVASGDDAMVRVFRVDTRDLLNSIRLEQGPNRIVYEPHAKLVYVGYGGKDAVKDHGEVGIIDGMDDKHIDDIKVAAHPSELLLNASGNTLFVFISAANQLQVVDTNKRQVRSTWKVSSEHPEMLSSTNPHLACLSERARLPR